MSRLLISGRFLLCAIFFGTFAASGLCSSSAQERQFITNSRLQLGTESNLSASVRAGDLDGDADIDLVVANGRHWPQQNYIFLNDGRGRFNTMRPLGADRCTSYACEIADLDGDGDLDIVTGNAMAPCNIFLNDGTAKFEKKSDLGSISSVRSITVADLDGDQDVDILATCRGLPNSIYLNDGAAGFATSMSFGTRDDSTIDVAVGDINRDERMDLLLANRDGQPNSLLVHSQDSKYETITLDQEPRNSRAIAVADFDGDGVLDWVVGNIGSRDAVYLGDGQGSYRKEVLFGSPDAQTYSIATGDVDNDGDIDLIAGRVLGKNAVYYNRGDGQGFAEQLFGVATDATYGLCVADLDGDGFLDIAVANSDTENRVYLNRPASQNLSPTRSERASTPSNRPSSIVNSQSELVRASPNETSDDWPSFRGIGGRGVSENQELPTQWSADPEESIVEGVKWRRKVSGLGHSSPVVVGHRLYIATAVSAEGNAPLQIGRGGAPEAADDNGEQEWRIYCFAKQTGEELWMRTCKKGLPQVTRHAKATHANSTLAIDGNRLVAFFGAEGLYCYDLNGELIWQKDLGAINISKYGIGWGYASSPAIHNDRIVLVCDDPEQPFLVALSLEDGEEIWRVARDGDSERNWSTPFIYAEPDGETNQVIVNGWPSVISYDLANGEELWRINGGGDNPVPTPFEVNGLIYITSAHGDKSPIHVIHPQVRGDVTDERLDSPNNSFLWSVDRGGAYMSTPVVYGDYLYLGNSNGVVRCFHATSGEKIYEHRLESAAGIIASLVAGDDKIYCASENGNVYVLKAGPEFEILATNPMAAPCFATPAISAGTMFFRTTKELIAIEH